MPIVVVIGGVAIDVVTALAILLAAYAAGVMLIKPLAWLLGNLPVIGHNIADALNSGLQAFENWAQDNAKNAIAAIVNPISAIVFWLQQVLETAVQSVELLFQQAVHTIQNAVALALQVARGFSSFVQQLGAIGDRITAVIASITSIATSIVRNAIAALETKVRDWIGAIYNAIAQAIDTAHVELGHAIDGFNIGLHNLDLALRHTIAVAIDGVQTWVNERLHPIEKEIGDIQTWVESVPAVAEIVGTIEAVKVIEKIVESCVKPTCSGLGPSLDILNAIADGTALAEMLALVALAAHDPEGASREITGVVNGVEGLVRSILEPAGIAA